jgi:hypothetical protein
MTLDCKVRDYRGCERADVIVDPIALVAGPNGAGKTSFAQAIAAVLTGEALLRGVSKQIAGVLVRGSQASGAATVQTESGTARVDWPACTRRTERQPPEASRFAAGIVSVADLPPAERTRAFAEVLKADPTRDDLAAAIGEHVELDDEAVTAAVWDLIERSGWDGALAARRERGAELKGQWRQITGANYGSRVAASWRRELEDERRTEAELAAVFEAARREHERAVGSSAASAADRQRMTELAGAQGDRNKALVDAEAAVAAAEAEVAKAREARRALPSGEQSEAEVGCPSCGTMLVVRRGASLLDPPALELAGTTPKLTAAEVKERRMALATADGQIANREDVLRVAQRARSVADVELQAAIDAGLALAALPPASDHQVDPAATRAALDRAESYNAEVRAKRRADEIADRIAGNEIVLDLLAPDGLRARKLGAVVELFNERLAWLCAAAGWRPLTIDTELELAYGGRRYPLLSASEQFRVRVILQVAMAKLDGSALVLIDAADILDGPGRADLFELLRTAGVPAIVCMTLARREQAPDLAVAGLGRTYWIEGPADVARALGAGVTAPIERQAAAA